jgi:hypothetical protein
MRNKVERDPGQKIKGGSYIRESKGSLSPEVPTIVLDLAEGGVELWV